MGQNLGGILVASALQNSEDSLVVFLAPFLDLQVGMGMLQRNLVTAEAGDTFYLAQSATRAWRVPIALGTSSVLG